MSCKKKRIMSFYERWKPRYLFTTKLCPQKNHRYWKKLFQSVGFSDTAKEHTKVGGLLKIILFLLKAKTFTSKKTKLLVPVLLPKSQALLLNPHLPFIPLSCLFPWHLDKCSHKSSHGISPWFINVLPSENSRIMLKGTLGGRHSILQLHVGPTSNSELAAQGLIQPKFEQDIAGPRFPTPLGPRSHTWPPHCEKFFFFSLVRVLVLWLVKVPLSGSTACFPPLP